MRALLLPVGRDTYAIPVDAAREVVGDPRATPVPTAPRALLGLLNVRGEIVPLFDTRSLLEAVPSPSCAYAVVVESSRGHGALAATGLPVVAELGDPVASAELPGATTVHRVDDRLVTLLDVEGVFGAAGPDGAGSAST